MTFADFAREQGLRLAPEDHHHGRAGWRQLDCPFCGKNSQRFHMGYNLTFRYFNCWKCGSQRPLDVLVALLDVSFSKAHRLWGSIDGTAPITQKYIDAEEKELVLPSGIDKLTKKHRRYLKGRGYDPEVISKLWAVQGIGLSSRLSWRLFIPIHLHHRMISWTTRAVTEYAKVRYLSASEDEERLPHKRMLYGMDYTAKRGVVICEGPLDVWSVGPGAVATFGLSFTRSQLLQLSKFQTRVICFDSEKFAQKQAEHLADQLEIFPGNTIIATLDSGDPGEASRREIRQLRKCAGI